MASHHPHPHAYTRTRTRVLNAGRYTGDLAVLRPDWNTGAPRPAGKT
ncbi:hypothetical protein ACFVHS_30020 [Streptomyces sp. NPDC057746]